MGTPGGAKGSGKGGSAGASNADLQDDEDLMARKAMLRHNFDRWKKKRKPPSALIAYEKSPNPPINWTRGKG